MRTHNLARKALHRKRVTRRVCCVVPHLNAKVGVTSTYVEEYCPQMERVASAWSINEDITDRLLVL